MKRGEERTGSGEESSILQQERTPLVSHHNRIRWVLEVHVPLFPVLILYCFDLKVTDKRCTFVGIQGLQLPSLYQIQLEGFFPLLAIRQKKGRKEKWRPKDDERISRRTLSILSALWYKYLAGFRLFIN